MHPKYTALLALLITAFVKFIEGGGNHAAAIAAASTGLLTVAHTLSHPPVRAKARKVLSRRQGGNPSLGLWVWNAEGPHEDVLKAHAHKYGWLVLKAHDGDSLYNTPYRIEQYHDLCKKYGIKFGIWGYCRHAEDAAIAAKLCHRYGATFYIADIEVEFEQQRRSEATVFARLFRHLAPQVDPWLSSFGRIDLHPDIDYRAFRDAGFGFMPQAYSCESQELTPQVCLRHATDVWHHSRVQPTLGAYAGARGRLPAHVLAGEAKGLGLSGVNVWDAQSATDKELAEVARIL